MSAEKTERLLNLVICLLSTQRGVSRDHIRQAIPHYAQQQDATTFERMFERDKDELRELGVPLEVVPADPFFRDALGYRISPADYELPEVEFAADERAVLGLAARLWQQASLAGPATRALTKLSALGASPTDQSLVGIEPRVSATDPAFDRLWAAVRDRVPVTFDYRKPGSEQPQLRRLEPWSVTSWRGRWYVAGFDRDRKASRVFRLSRIRGHVQRIGTAGSFEPTADQVAGNLFSDFLSEPCVPTSVALLWLRPERGQALRRRGAQQAPSGINPQDWRQAGAAMGWEAWEVPFAEPQYLVGELAELGAAVRVIAPIELRDSLRQHLIAVCTAHG